LESLLLLKPHTSELSNVSVTWRKWSWLAGLGRHTLSHGKQTWIRNCK